VPPRFYAPHLDPAQPALTLPPGESQHLTRVLRLGAGEAVEVFDGRGHMHAAVVTLASPAGTLVQVGAAVAAQREPPCGITLCVGLLKGDAMDAVVRDATVLGVTRIVPVITARTNVPRGSLASGRALDRWQRVAIAAAKQCGRAVLPTLDEAARPFDQLVDDEAFATDQRVLLVEPAAAPDTRSDDLERRATVLAMGPEGGWAPEEVTDAMRHGWQPWSLGPFTLRAEQVTLAALAVLRHRWGLGACGGRPEWQ
jgi:16S rRNA (uracil1498-N3)-methyltransferase